VAELGAGRIQKLSYLALWTEYNIVKSAFFDSSLGSSTGEHNITSEALGYMQDEEMATVLFFSYSSLNDWQTRYLSCFIAGDERVVGERLAIKTKQDMNLCLESWTIS
jgi:hypothetical protein